MYILIFGLIIYFICGITGLSLLYSGAFVSGVTALIISFLPVPCIVIFLKENPTYIKQFLKIPKNDNQIIRFKTLPCFIFALLPGLLSHETSEWFRLGTLHDVSASEWQAGKLNNKLATAADWVAFYMGGDNISSVDDLRSRSVKLLKCLENYYEDDGAIMVSYPPEDIAFACMKFENYPEKNKL